MWMAGFRGPYPKTAAARFAPHRGSSRKPPSWIDRVERCWFSVAWRASELFAYRNLGVGSAVDDCRLTSLSGPIVHPLTTTPFDPSSTLFLLPGKHLAMHCRRLALQLRAVCVLDSWTPGLLIVRWEWSWKWICSF